MKVARLESNIRTQGQLDEEEARYQIALFLRANHYAGVEVMKRREAGQTWKQIALVFKLTFWV
jgi:hypothetical protein